jgi:hypothetical protein
MRFDFLILNILNSNLVINSGLFVGSHLSEWMYFKHGSGINNCLWTITNYDSDSTYGQQIFSQEKIFRDNFFDIVVIDGSKINADDLKNLYNNYINCLKDVGINIVFIRDDTEHYQFITSRFNAEINGESVLDFFKLKQQFSL